METYINIGNYDQLGKEVFQLRIETIANFYHADNYIDVDCMLTYGKDDTIIRLVSNFSYLAYASKKYYESAEWEQAVNIISYDKWLHTLPAQELPYSEKEPHHYIYLLKDNLSFALMTMNSDVAHDYITLLDYSDIGEVNVYTADYLLNSVPSGFDMDKFYQIPVKDSENATINDVFDFLKKEK